MNSGGGFYFGKRRSQVIALESLSSSFSDPNQTVSNPQDRPEPNLVSEKQIEAFKNQAGARSVMRPDDPYMAANPYNRGDVQQYSLHGYHPQPQNFGPNYGAYPPPYQPNYPPQGLPYPPPTTGFYTGPGYPPQQIPEQSAPRPAPMGPLISHAQPQYGYPAGFYGQPAPRQPESPRPASYTPVVPLPLREHTVYFLGTFEDKPWLQSVAELLGIRVVTNYNNIFKFLVRGNLPKVAPDNQAEMKHIREVIRKAQSYKSELCDVNQFCARFKADLFDNTLDAIHEWKPDGPTGFLSYYSQLKSGKAEPTPEYRPSSSAVIPAQSEQMRPAMGYSSGEGYQTGPTFGQYAGSFPSHQGYHDPLNNQYPLHMQPGYNQMLHPQYQQIPSYPAQYNQRPHIMPGPQPHYTASTGPASFFRGQTPTDSMHLLESSGYCSSRMTKFINPPAHIKKQWENSRIKPEDNSQDRRHLNSSSVRNYKEELKDLATFGPGVDFKPVKYSAYQSTAPARKAKTKPPLSVTPEALAPEPELFSEKDLMSRVEEELGVSPYQKPEESLPPQKQQAPGSSHPSMRGHPQSPPQNNQLVAFGSNRLEQMMAPRPMADTADPEWSVLYRPLTLDTVIGNKPVIVQLQGWIETWLKGEVLKTPNSKRGALLTGPPGIGKTTTVRLLAEKYGYNLIEKNASELRNKQNIEPFLKILSANTTLDWYGHFTRSLIVMDEVDGMTSDAQGIPTLTDLIAKTKVPIICIANERYHQKIRNLANHCIDLKFKKPEPDEVLAYLRPIVKAEFKKQDIKDATLSELIRSMNCDLRQLLNYLENSKRSKRLLSDPAVGFCKDKSSTLTPLEAASVLMCLKDRKNLNYRDLSHLFFVDWEMVPPFVHENYLQSTARNDKLSDLVKLSKAADSLCRADMVLGELKSDHNYKLLDSYAFYSCLYPTFLVSVQVQKMEFPDSFQRNSSQKRMRQELIDLRTVTLGSLWGSSESLKLELSGALLYMYRYHIAKISEGQSSDGLISMCEQYHLTPDTLCEYIGSMVFDPLKRDPFTGLSLEVRKRASADFNAKHKDDLVRTKRRRFKQADGDGDGDRSDGDDDGLEADQSKIRGKKNRRMDGGADRKNNKRGGGGKWQGRGGRGGGGPPRGPGLPFI